MVRQYEYQPCIPTRGTEVLAGPDWFHEIKHDGYRLIVRRYPLRLLICRAAETTTPWLPLAKIRFGRRWSEA